MLPVLCNWYYIAYVYMFCKLINGILCEFPAVLSVIRQLIFACRCDVTAVEVDPRTARQQIGCTYLHVVFHERFEGADRVDQVGAHQLPGGFALEGCPGIFKGNVQWVFGRNLGLSRRGFRSSLQQIDTLLGDPVLSGKAVPHRGPEEGHG